MNHLYDEFMASRPHVFTKLPKNAPSCRSPLNNFQKSLLKNGEFGYFQTKNRQEGATTALAAFTSFYMFTHPDTYILYLSPDKRTGDGFKRILQSDWFDNYGGVANGLVLMLDRLVTSSLERLEMNTIGRTIKLVMIDEIHSNKMNDRDISILHYHASPTTIWLSTTSMI